MLKFLKRLVGGRPPQPPADHGPPATALAGPDRTGLRESEEHFAQLVAGVRDYAVFLLDRDGRVLTWNAGAERAKGYARRRDRRPALLHLLPARRRVVRVAGPRAGGGRRHRPVRGRGVAGPQGRHPVLGERRHHRPAGRVGRGPRVPQDHPRPDRPQAGRGEAAALARSGSGCWSRGSRTTPSSCSTRHGRVATWNAGAERLKGYAAAEIVGRHFSSVLPAGGDRPGVAGRGVAAGRGRRPARGRGVAGPQGRHHRSGRTWSSPPSGTRPAPSAGSPR